MTITVRKYNDIGHKLGPSMSIFIEGENDIKAFKEMVFRGNNLEPNNPVSIKEMSDTVLHGKQLQNYREMYK